MVQVVGVAHTFVEVWETVAGMLTELDVLLGFAELAVCAPTPYVRPTMLGAEAGAFDSPPSCIHTCSLWVPSLAGVVMPLQPNYHDLKSFRVDE